MMRRQMAKIMPPLARCSDLEECRGGRCSDSGSMRVPLFRPDLRSLWFSQIGIWLIQWELRIFRQLGRFRCELLLP
jgi:hypothetical protein